MALWGRERESDFSTIRDKTKMHLVLLSHVSIKPGLLVTCLAPRPFTALLGCITGVYTQCLPGSLILKAAWDLRAVCLGLAVVPTFAKTQTFN